MKRVLASCLAVLLLCAGVTPEAGAETYSIEIRNHNFYPPSLVIKVGDTVEWVNKMNYGHWVISGVDMRHDNKFFSYMLLNGHKFSHTFNVPGDYPYYCPIHSMQALISVVEDKVAGEKKKEDPGEGGEQRRRRR